MSNDVTIMGTELASPLPGGKSVEIVNAPLRAIAPALRVAATCRPELDKLWKAEESIVSTNEMLSRKHDETYTKKSKCGGLIASSSEANYMFLDLVRLEEARLTRETLLPRFVEVRRAYDVLSSVCDGEQDIDAPTALKMLSVLHRVLQKKKDDPVSLMAFASLFDPDVDSVGVSLNLWKEVPRHPVIVALAVQYLFHAQVFTPTPAELCDACRNVGGRLKARYRDTMQWMHQLSKADAELFETVRDEWASIYTTSESLAAAPVFGPYTSDVEARKKLMWERNATIREMQKMMEE